MSQARHTFYELIDKGHHEQAAAAIALAEAMERLTTIHAADLLSHGIALGIRKGLFGANAEDNADIREAIYDG